MARIDHDGAANPCRRDSARHPGPTWLYTHSWAAWVCTAAGCHRPRKGMTGYRKTDELREFQ
jgi:hypothetical protein